MRFFSLFFILVSVSLISQTSRADPGDLDTGFGNNGIVTSDFGKSEGIADLMLVGNGQILVTGDHFLDLGGVDSSILLASYDSNGGLTTGFGSGGVTTTNLGHPVHSKALASQSSGQIIVAGSIDLDDNGFLDAFVVARYDADGTLDTSFGTNNGWSTIDFTGDENARGMAIQDDDKIVVVGEVDSDMAADFDAFGVARFNADGTPDNGFGNNGAVTTVFAGNFFASARAVVIQGNSQIVVAGTTAGTDQDFALVRYNASDGSLDMSFGSGGMISSVFGSGVSIGTDLTLQPDGKILMVGGQDTNNDSVDDTIALARFNPDGSLDTSFGGDGKSTPDIGIAAEAKSVALQSNGQIVVGGGAAVNPTLSIPIADFFMLARLNSDGSLDPTFGTSGSVTTEVGPKSQANSIAIQSDGKIVAGGFVDQDDDGTFDADDDFALVRYLGGAANGGGGNGGGGDGGGGCQLGASTSGTFFNMHLFLLAIAGWFIARRCARQD